MPLALSCQPSPLSPCSFRQAGARSSSFTAIPPSTRPSTRLPLALQFPPITLIPPQEIANLHSFPASFHFPPHITLRQRYQLLGNSLSAAVVADLLAYLVRDGPHRGGGAD